MGQKANKWIFGLLAAGLVFAGGVLAVVVFLLLIFLSFPQEEERPGYAGGEISEYGAGEIPAEYIPIYQAAAAEYNIPWNLLAAVHRVETVFSTLEPMESYAGAIGHFQFMPCTWTGWNHPSCGGLGRGNIPRAELIDPNTIDRYGGYGVDASGSGTADPFDIEDATYTAAKYLAENGAASGNYRAAIFAYNHSEAYVNQVTEFMQQYVNYSAVDLVPGTGGFSRPMITQVTSHFGPRLHPIERVYKLHGGIDFACSVGQPVPASKEGVVTYAGWMNANNPNAGYGIYVWIEHAGGYKTTYAHLVSTNVVPGQVVEAGHIVGGCGSTGASTGPHLHFEIFKNNILVDPAPYIGVN